MGGHKILNGSMSLGGFLSCNIFLSLLVLPVSQIVAAATQITEAIVGLERTREILNEEVEGADPGAGFCRGCLVAVNVEPPLPSPCFPLASGSVLSDRSGYSLRLLVQVPGLAGIPTYIRTKVRCVGPRRAPLVVSLESLVSAIGKTSMELMQLTSMKFHQLF